MQFEVKQDCKPVGLRNWTREMELVHCAIVKVNRDLPHIPDDRLAEPIRHACSLALVRPTQRAVTMFFLRKHKKLNLFVDSKKCNP